ncbi:MAG TPA: hypothetical protein VEF53_02240 [Patescibacteria group bacterium]|nr:hypothetical protein [Patescibacteria group bacterium]
MKFTNGLFIGTALGISAAMMMNNKSQNNNQGAGQQNNTQGYGMQNNTQGTGIQNKPQSYSSTYGLGNYSADNNAKNSILGDITADTDTLNNEYIVDDII